MVSEYPTTPPAGPERMACDPMKLNQTNKDLQIFIYYTNKTPPRKYTKHMYKPILTKTESRIRNEPI